MKISSIKNTLKGVYRARIKSQSEYRKDFPDTFYEAKLDTLKFNSEDFILERSGSKIELKYNEVAKIEVLE